MTCGPSALLCWSCCIEIITSPAAASRCSSTPHPSSTQQPLNHRRQLPCSCPTLPLGTHSSLPSFAHLPAFLHFLPFPSCAPPPPTPHSSLLFNSQLFPPPILLDHLTSSSSRIYICHVATAIHPSSCPPPLRTALFSVSRYACFFFESFCCNQPQLRFLVHSFEISKAVTCPTAIITRNLFSQSMPITPMPLVDIAALPPLRSVVHARGGAQIRVLLLRLFCCR